MPDFDKPNAPQSHLKLVIDAREMLREEKRLEIISLTQEVAQSGEVFPFHGVDQKFYSNTKADEAKYPGMTTPIDDIIDRFKKEGMIVVIGKHPENANIYILPSKSDDINNDMVDAKNFLIDESMPENLKKLISMDIERERARNSEK